MCTVRDVLARKGSEIFSVPPNTTVLEAADLMNDRRIGGVLIMEGETLLGIFTERDVLQRVIAKRVDPATITIDSVMTSDLLTVTASTTLDDCGAVMTQRRLRHLPVLEDGKVLGVVTIGDVLAQQVHEAETVIEDLNKYVFNLR